MQDKKQMIDKLRIYRSGDIIELISRKIQTDLLLDKAVEISDRINSISSEDAPQSANSAERIEY